MKNRFWPDGKNLFGKNFFRDTAGKEFWYVTKGKNFLVLELRKESYKRIILGTGRNKYWTERVNKEINQSKTS